MAAEYGRGEQGSRGQAQSWPLLACPRRLVSQQAPSGSPRSQAPSGSPRLPVGVPDQNIDERCPTPVLAAQCPIACSPSAVLSTAATTPLPLPARVGCTCAAHTCALHACCLGPLSLLRATASARPRLTTYTHATAAVADVAAPSGGPSHYLGCVTSQWWMLPASEMAAAGGPYAAGVHEARSTIMIASGRSYHKGMLVLVHPASQRQYGVRQAHRR